MNIHFRVATPKDVDAAVPLIFSSGPGAFDYIFSPKPGQAQEFLRYTFQDGAGEFGYKNHVVCELDKKVVAIGAAFDGESTIKFFLAMGRQINRLILWAVIVHRYPARATSGTGHSAAKRAFALHRSPRRGPKPAKQRYRCKARRAFDGTGQKSR